MTMENRKCDIEQHAVLFALIAREVITSFEDDGVGIVRRCVMEYGRERGLRMHDRCLEHNDPLTPINYQAYNERSSKPGQMNSVFVEKSPEAVIHVMKCAWVDAWRKYDLLEWGKYYCLDIDKSLTRGFSADQYEVKIYGHLSWGKEFCNMHWGFDMTSEAEQYIKEKRKELSSEGAVLSYDYHTGHLFSSFTDTLHSLKGERGLECMRKALVEFKKKYPDGYVEAFCRAYELSSNAEDIIEPRIL